MRFSRILICLLCAAPHALNADEPTLAEGRKILQEIRAGATAHYASYQGVRARRTAVTREIDPDTGKQKRELKSITSHTTYYRKRPVIKVLSCRENGKKVEAKKCAPRETPDPLYPVFGPRSGRYYSLKVMDTRTVGGEACWRIKVTPRQRTARHFRGFAYFTKNGLRLKAMRGRPANLKFGLKSMYTSIRFKAIGKVPVIGGGSVQLRVKVPLVYNAIIKIRFSESGHVLIRR